MDETQGTGNRYYLHLRAWCRMMGSTESYTYNQVQQARTDKAPADAIYRTTDGKWRRFADVHAEETRQLITEILAELKG